MSFFWAKSWLLIQQYFLKTGFEPEWLFDYLEVQNENFGDVAVDERIISQENKTQKKVSKQIETKRVHQKGKGNAANPWKLIPLVSEKKLGTLLFKQYKITKNSPTKQTDITSNKLDVNFHFIATVINVRIYFNEALGWGAHAPHTPFNPPLGDIWQNNTSHNYRREERKFVFGLW